MRVFTLKARWDRKLSLSCSGKRSVARAALRGLCWGSRCRQSPPALNQSPCWPGWRGARSHRPVWGTEGSAPGSTAEVAVAWDARVPWGHGKAALPGRSPGALRGGWQRGAPALGLHLACGRGAGAERLGRRVQQHLSVRIFQQGGQNFIWGQTFSFV